MAGVGIGTGCGCEDTSSDEQLILDNEQGLDTLNGLSVALESFIHAVNNNNPLSPVLVQTVYATLGRPGPGVETYSVGIESIMDKAKDIAKSILAAAVEIIRSIINYIFGDGKMGGRLYSRVMPDWADYMARSQSYAQRGTVKFSEFSKTLTKPQIIKLDKALQSGPLAFMMSDGGVDFHNKMSGLIQIIGTEFGAHWGKLSSTMPKLFEPDVVAGAGLSDEEMADLRVPESIYSKLTDAVNDMYGTHGSWSSKTNATTTGIKDSAKQFKDMLRTISNYHGDVSSSTPSYTIPPGFLKNLQLLIDPALKYAEKQQPVLEKAQKDMEHMERINTTAEMPEIAVKQIRILVSEIVAVITTLMAWFSFNLKAGASLMDIEDVLASVGEKTRQDAS